MSSNFTCRKMCLFYLTMVRLQLETLVSIATIPCWGLQPYYLRMTTPVGQQRLQLSDIQLLTDLLLIPKIRSRFTTSLNQCFEQFCVYIDQIGFHSFLCSRSKCYCPSQWQPNRIKVDRRKLTLKRKKKERAAPKNFSREKLQPKKFISWKFCCFLKRLRLMQLVNGNCNWQLQLLASNYNLQQQLVTATCNLQL